MREGKFIDINIDRWKEYQEDTSDPDEQADRFVHLIDDLSYAKTFYPKPLETKVVVIDKTNIKQAVFKIKGMTCESCTQHLNSEISKVKGIITFQTSFENANSIVKFDISKTSIDSIASAINSTGYKVVSQTVINN